MRFYTENGRFAFLSPKGDFGGTYDDHLMLIGFGKIWKFGKSVVDFIIVLLERFSLGVTCGWGDTSEYQEKIGVFAPTGLVWPNISGIRGHPTNHYLCHCRQRIYILHVVWAELSFILSQSTRLTEGQTDERTDGQTDSFILTRPRCMQCIQRQWRHWGASRSAHSDAWGGSLADPGLNVKGHIPSLPSVSYTHLTLPTILRV